MKEGRLTTYILRGVIVVHKLLGVLPLLEAESTGTLSGPGLLEEGSSSGSLER